MRGEISRDMGSSDRDGSANNVRYLAIAERLSEKAKHPKHKLGAVVVAGGRILAAATNLGKWHACAERRAIRNRIFDGGCLYVARSNGRCSKPCDECMVAIRESGIRTVVYIEQDGSVGELSL